MAIRPHSTAYNAKGQIAEIIDLVNNEKSVYSYDISGRLLRISQTGGKSISTGYDILNRVTELNYQFAGQVKTVSFGYGKDGQKGKSTLLSGAEQTATYDSLGRETSSKVGDLTREIEYLGVSGKRTTTLPETLNYKYNGTTLLETEYAYDTRGNISQMTVDGVTFIYTYDSLNQLTGVTGSNGYSASYTYTAGGNITSKTVGNDHFTYGYTDTNWKDKLKSYNGCPISYDGMGNPTQNYIGTLSWEGRQLIGIAKTDGTQISYTYNSNSIRTKKTVGSNTTEYFLDGSTILAEKTGNNVIWYIYDTGGELLGFTYNGTPYYYLKNQQGDVYKIVDTNGTIVGSYTYDPWGKVIADGTMAQINPIRYRSYYYDSETQLYYLQSRYYDPELGRFISSDRFVSTGQGFAGHNMFTYCGNNPVNSVDHTGKLAAWAVALIIVGTMLVATAIDHCLSKNVPDGYVYDSQYIGNGHTIQTGYAYGSGPETTTDDVTLLDSEIAACRILYNDEDNGIQGNLNFFSAVASGGADYTGIPGGGFDAVASVFSANCEWHIPISGCSVTISLSYHLLGAGFGANCDFNDGTFSFTPPSVGAFPTIEIDFDSY